MRRRSSRVEALERRVLLSTVTAVASGLWGDPNNWIDDIGKHRLPGASDDVILGGFALTHDVGNDTVKSLLGSNLTLSGGSLAVTAPSELDGGDTFSGGGLFFNGPLLLKGNNVWSAGSFGGADVLTNTGTLSLSGTNTKFLGGVLNNAGTIVHGGGNLQLDFVIGPTGFTGTLNNQLGSVYDLQADVTLSHQLGDAAAINNSGTFRKSAGTGTAAIAFGLPFHNTGGTIDVESGTLTLIGGTHTGGTFSAGSGAALQLTGVNAITGNYTGAGAGTVQLAGNFTVGAGGATLNFPNGLFQWTTGRMDGGSAGLSNTGTLTFAPDGSGDGLYGLVNNSGTIIQTGTGTVGIDINATVTNLATGIYDFQGNGVLDTGANARPATTLNRGILRKSSGTGTATITGGAFANAGGTVDVRSGTLALANYGGISTGGVFAVAAGAVLDLTGGQGVTYAGTYTGSGQGTVEVASGELAIDSAGATFNLPAAMFQWTGGAIYGGTAGLTNAGTVTLAGAGAKYLGGILNNTGNIVHTGGNFQLDFIAGFPGTVFTGTFNNQAGAVYDLQADVTFNHQVLDAAAINNSGTFRKSAGTGIASVANIPFNNTGGTIDVESGTLSLSGGTHSGGTFSAGAGAILSLAGVNALTGSYGGSGSGTVQLAGTFNIGATGAVFNFPAGLLQWVSGSHITGSNPGLTNVGTLTVAVGATGFLVGEINNSGTFIESGACFIEIDGGAEFVNLPGAVFDYQGDGGVVDATSHAGTHLFTNLGTVRKSGGTVSNMTASGFDTIGGVVDVQTGTLELAAGSSTGGTFKVAAGAVLDLTDGNTVTYKGAYTASGAGTIQVAGGILATDPAGATFNFPPGMFQWTGGAINGNGAGLTNAGTMTLSGAATKVLGGTLNNAGSILHTSGNLETDFEGSYPFPIFSGTLNNTGLYDLQTDATLTIHFAQDAINNSGTWRKSAGAGAANVNVHFSNTGTVEVRSGTLAFGAGVAQISGNTLTGGTWNVLAGATLNLPSNSLTTNQANVTLDGSGSTFNAIAGLSSNAGSLSLLDGRGFTTGGDFSNAGSLTLGAASTLSVTGNYSQSAPASLSVQIGGMPASGQFGQLSATGAAALGGTFNVSLVNGFGPAAGQSFQIMSFASATGAFATIGGLKSGRFTIFSANLSATAFTLNGTTSSADLAFDSFGTLPTTALPGQVVSVPYTVRNLSSTPATGDWYDSIYLSTNSLLDPSDVLLGRVHHVGDVVGMASYTETLTAPLPNLSGGNYRILALVDSRGLVPDTNRPNNLGVSTGSLAVSIPILTFGVPATGTIANGQDLYFKVVVPPAKDVTIAANFTTAPEAEFFLRYGSLPDGSTFDQMAPDRSDLHPVLTLMNAQGGTYYVLLHGVQTATGAQPFSLKADLVPYGVSTFDPHEGSNQGHATLLLEGTGFTPQTVVTLRNISGTSLRASSQQFQDASHLTADFDLTQSLPGAYNVQTQDGGQVSTAPSQFTVTNGQRGLLSLRIASPGAVRVGANIGVSIEVRNTGETDIPGPLLEVMATNVQPGQERMDLSGGPNHLRNVVPPNGDFSTSLSYRPSPKAAGTESDFSLLVINPSTTPIDWDSQKNNFRPSNIPADAWDAIWANFRASVGNTLADLYTALTNDAEALAQVGVFTTDVGRLTGFELQKANDSAPSPVLTGSTDLAFPAPGLSLDFGRSFQQSIAGRYNLGRLGRGWIDDFDISAANDSSTGVVTITEGAASRFFALQDDGSYKGAPGDIATLTVVHGAFQLRESDGSLTAFRPDGSLDYLQDTNNNKITAGYTGSQLTSLTHSDGSVLTLNYNAQGRISQATDPAGRVATYAYDASGENLLSVTTAQGTTAYVYTPDTSGPKAHALSSITNPDGTNLFYDYDSRGRLFHQQRDGGAETTTFAYGPASFSGADALNNVSTYFFDDLGRVKRISDPLNRSGAFSFDDQNNPVGITESGGATATLGYDSRANPIRAIDPLGQEQDFSYDPALNRLTSWKDALGNTTTYGLDSNGNLTSTTSADRSVTKFTYDSQGNVATSVDPLGQIIRYTHDSHGLLLGKDLPDGTHFGYTYDTHGNLLTATGPQGTTTMTYDAADRLTQVTYANGRFLKYVYDFGGRLTQTSDQDGFTVNYAYDAVGRLQKLTDASGALIASYTFDAAGRLQRQDNGNGTFTTYDYDPAGQLLHLINYAPGGKVNSRFDHTYDNLGRRASLTTLDGTASYAYDAGGHLISVVLPGGRTITYAYDAEGNRTKVTDSGTTTNYRVNNLNQYTNVGGANQAFDTDGNQTVGSGPNGPASYTYDSEGRLLTITTSQGTWSYEYDALGNRIASTHNGVRTEYLVDPSGRVVGEYDGGGHLVAHYTQGAGLTSRVDAVGQADYYSFDASGNTAQLTGPGGAVLNTYTYLPFGEPQLLQESVANPFTFAGQFGVSQEGGGLLSMGARSYDPSQGRFVQSDPIGLAGGTNLYAYANNNPLTFIDPSGLATKVNPSGNLTSNGTPVQNPGSPTTYTVLDAAGRAELALIQA